MRLKAISAATLLALLVSTTTVAQTFDFDMTREQPTYSNDVGYGYDLLPAPNLKEKRAPEPFYFSVKVDEGNYRVSVTIGSKTRTANTTVRAENRRLFVEPTTTAKGEFKTFSFLVNIHEATMTGPLKDSGKEAPEKVKITGREKKHLNWDGKLTLEFNGDAPAVKSIHIEPAGNVPTLYLCGNSTVTDQDGEPYTSWGQIITRWMDDSLVVANYAESGLKASTFLAANRLDKILTTINKGDYVVVEFGHNDEKEHGYGDGPWYNYSRNLKIFIDRVRKAGGNIVLITPTQRRSFQADSIHVKESHGDYPKAMKAVAERENVPLIDLTLMTTQLLEAMGPEGSKRMLVHYPMGSYPSQTKALADDTHHNPYGAHEVAKCVIMGMKELGLPIVRHLRPEWQDFDPTRPDDPATIQWPAAKTEAEAKPAGN